MRPYLKFSRSQAEISFLLVTAIYLALALLLLASLERLKIDLQRAVSREVLRAFILYIEELDKFCREKETDIEYLEIYVRVPYRIGDPYILECLGKMCCIKTVRFKECLNVMTSVPVEGIAYSYAGKIKIERVSGRFKISS